MFDREDSAFTLAGFLLLSALGLFAWNATPLDSARPITKKIESSEQKQQARIPARLWQDPFKASKQYLRADNQPPCNNLTDVIRQKEGQELIVLSVMVSGEPYAEVEEQRRRRRYAVLSALGDTHYVPEDAESLGIAYSTTKEGGTILIPYEWFVYEDSAQDKNPNSHNPVLVLWLNEADFSQAPFASFNQLIKPLSMERMTELLAWKVLGPNTSSTLREMVKAGCSSEVEWLGDKFESGLHQFHIFSPMATVPDSDLRSLTCEGKSQSTNSESNSILGFQFDKGEQTLLFRRTIRSDDELIERLVKELGNRRVKQTDAVVVISEWDTYFGRTLPKLLQGKRPQPPKACQDQQEEGSLLCFFKNLVQGRGGAEKKQEEENLLRYTYVRGIDGIAPGIAHSKAEDTSKVTRSGIEELATGSSAAVRRPGGTGQFDYLRRLGNKMLEEDQRLRIETGRGIRAVAVLGSDVFDKLLILRALRPKLPSAIWLTTDIDAHLLHPSEFQWTRNLVVASSYGLLPGDKIEHTTPPFRDGYQTSTYMATRMAVDPSTFKDIWRHDHANGYPSQKAIDQTIPAQLFEVGRHSFVPLLTRAEQGEKKQQVVINIDQPADTTTPYLIGMFLMTALALLAIQQLRPNAIKILLGIGVAVSVLLLLAGWIHYSGGVTEPFGFREGVSIWPTEFIRLCALFLAITWVVRIRRQLRQNWLDINQRYLGFDLSDKEEEKIIVARNWFDRAFKAICNCPAWVPGSVLAFVAMMAAMIVMKRFSLPLTYHLAVLAIVWVVIIGLWLAFISGKLTKRVQALSVNKWVSEKFPTLQLLWLSYGEYGKTEHRVLRTFAYTLIYFAFASIIFTLLGGASVPCRGALACTLDGIIIGLSVLSMLFLLFMVVDATRLCIYWIKKLLDENLEWEEQLLKKWSKRLGVPAEHTKYWLQIHLIGERTTEIGRLLYYPLMVILLILASRSTYFDNWGFPQALAVVVGLNFSVALATAFRLNHTARSARGRILERLQREKQDLREKESKVAIKPTSAGIRDLVKELSEVHMGAYQRPWDQPFVRSTLLLLGGIGISYAEYIPFG